MEGKSPSLKRDIIYFGLTFPEAIKVVMNGGKITRKEWENKEIYGYLYNSFLSLHKADGLNYQWIVNDGDLMGTDWVEIGG